MNSAAIFLMGPTASGKTGLAELLCEQLPCDVISVDSSAVYKGMDIGAAKPDACLQAKMPHRLIDIRAVSETYSAADFVADALREIADIQSRGRIPMLVGGTMLYFKALRDGLAELPPANAQIRLDIEKQAAEQGWPALHAELSKVDPAAGQRIHPNDPQRLQRALEVYRLTGQSLSDLQRQQHSTAARYKGPLLQMALQPYSRALLHQRIELRFRQMLDLGLVEEVRTLVSEPGVADLPAMRAAGYRQVIDHLRGDLSYEQMIERGVIATRQLAKRQLTWLRNWPDLLKLQASEHDYEGGLTANNGEESSIFDQALQISQHFFLNRDD
ncbi:MAG: tRNA (adenosine(37)-N6)-dimethylallyltransferase MiaA [Pseudomonadales bacterium]